MIQAYFIAETRFISCLFFFSPTVISQITVRIRRHIKSIIYSKSFFEVIRMQNIKKTRSFSVVEIRVLQFFQMANCSLWNVHATRISVQATLVQWASKQVVERQRTFRLSREDYLTTDRFRNFLNPQAVNLTIGGDYVRSTDKTAVRSQR